MNEILPKGDDGIIKRIEMPQVPDAKIPSLLSYLGTLGLEFTAGHMDPNMVKAHQAIDVQRAMKIPAQYIRTPVLISREPYILDGNHRWFRHSREGTLMPFIKIWGAFNLVRHFMMNFPGTYEEK